jgi:hypothetical protein
MFFVTSNTTATRSNNDADDGEFEDVLMLALILHNLELKADVVKESLEGILSDEDDFSSFDDAERAPYEEGDALNQGIPGSAPKDERRTRLMFYFEEHHYFV